MIPNWDMVGGSGEYEGAKYAVKSFTELYWLHLGRRHSG